MAGDPREFVEIMHRLLTELEVQSRQFRKHQALAALPADWIQQSEKVETYCQVLLTTLENQYQSVPIAAWNEVKILEGEEAARLLLADIEKKFDAARRKWAPVELMDLSQDILKNTHIILTATLPGNPIIDPPTLPPIRKPRGKPGR